MDLELAITGEIFTFGKYADALRIEQGKRNPNLLPKHPEERCGMHGNEWRLVPEFTSDGGSVPAAAYLGFLWCGIAPSLSDVPPETLLIPGRIWLSPRDKFLIRITLKSADDVYIADHAVFEKRRDEARKAAKGGRGRFTAKEIDEFLCVRGRTIRRINEYSGNYEKPIILIHRNLDFDEVEVVG